MTTKNKTPGYNNLYFWKAKNNPEELLMSCSVYQVDYSAGETVLLYPAAAGGLKPYQINDPDNYAKIKNEAEEVAQKILASAECIGFQIRRRKESAYHVAYITEAGTTEIAYTQKSEGPAKNPEHDILGRALPEEYTKVFAPLTLKLMKLLEVNDKKSSTLEL